MSKRTVYRAIWVPSVGVLIALVVLFAQRPTVLPPPAAMTTLTTSDKSITVSHPSNWQPLEGSLHAVETKVKFEPVRNVRMVIKTDLAGSLIADIDKAASGMLSALPGVGQQLAAKQKSPLEKLHDLQAKELETTLDGFQDGASTKGIVAGFDALLSDFTFRERSVWGSREMVGRRVTVAASERRLTVVYHCPRDVQAHVAPVFAQMLNSVRLGQGGG